jgi:GNAT superfamily N-acetyltransferase
VLPSNALFIRPARLEDCFEIARLFLMASEGLAEYIWSRMAEPGESLLEAGARRCSGEGIACSYENCFIAELANTTVGMLNSFPMGERDGPDDLNADPALRPLVELRDYGSLFVSGVAVFPEHRGRGIGTRLLATTEQQAVSYGLTRLSLICLEQNQGAMRLYSRLGFREIDRRPLVPHPVWRLCQGDAVLLTKLAGFKTLSLCSSVALPGTQDLS